MTGIVLLFFLFIAFVVYCLLIYLPIRWAKKRGITGRKRLYIGIASFIVVSVLFFGKNVVSYSAYKYYCANAAGLTVYKTGNQWRKENPGVWETLIINEYSINKRPPYPSVTYEKIIDGKKYTASYGDQRLTSYVRNDYIFWGAVDQHSRLYLDNKTQEILTEYKWYQWRNTWDTTRKSNGRRTTSYLGNESCYPDNNKPSAYDRK